MCNPLHSLVDSCARSPFKYKLIVLKRCYDKSDLSLLGQICATAGRSVAHSTIDQVCLLKYRFHFSPKEKNCIN